MLYSTSEDFSEINKISIYTLQNKLLKKKKILLHNNNDDDILDIIDIYINNLLNKSILDITINNDLENKIIYYKKDKNNNYNYKINHNKLYINDIIDIDLSYYVSENMKKYMFIYDFMSEYYLNLAKIKKDSYGIDNTTFYQHEFEVKVKYIIKKNFDGTNIISNIYNNNDQAYYTVKFKFVQPTIEQSDDDNLLIQPEPKIKDISLLNSVKTIYLDSFIELFTLIKKDYLNIDTNYGYYNLIGKSHEYNFNRLLLNYYIIKIIYFYFVKKYKTKVQEPNDIITKKYPIIFSNFNKIIINLQEIITNSDEYKYLYDDDNNEYITQESDKIKQAKKYKNKLKIMSDNIITNNKNAKDIQKINKSEKKYLNRLKIINYLTFFIFIITIFLFIVNYVTSSVNISIPIILSIIIILLLIVVKNLENIFFGKDLFINNIYFEAFADYIDPKDLTFTISKNDLFYYEKINAGGADEDYYTIDGIILDQLVSINCPTGETCSDSITQTINIVDTNDDIINMKSIYSDKSGDDEDFGNNGLIYFGGNNSVFIQKYILNIPKNIEVDILVVGGGGYGGNMRGAGDLHKKTNYGEGGAGGAVVFGEQILLESGEYEIIIGEGGVANIDTSSIDGQNTYIKKINTGGNDKEIIKAYGATHDPDNYYQQLSGGYKQYQVLADNYSDNSNIEILNKDLGQSDGGKGGRVHQPLNGLLNWMRQQDGDDCFTSTPECPIATSIYNKYYDINNRYTKKNQYNDVNGNDGIKISDILGLNIATFGTLSGGGGAVSGCILGEEANNNVIEYENIYYNCYSENDIIIAGSGGGTGSNKGGAGGIEGGGGGAGGGMGSDISTDVGVNYGKNGENSVNFEKGGGGGGGGGIINGGNGGHGLIIIKYNKSFIDDHNLEILTEDASDVLKDRLTNNLAILHEKSQENRESEILPLEEQISNYRDKIETATGDLEELESEIRLIRDKDLFTASQIYQQHLTTIEDKDNDISQKTTEIQTAQSLLDKYTEVDGDKNIEELIEEIRLYQEDATYLQKIAEWTTQKTNKETAEGSIIDKRLDRITYITKKLTAEHCKQVYNQKIFEADDILRDLRGDETALISQLISELNDKKSEAKETAEEAVRLRDIALNSQYDIEQEYIVAKETLKTLLSELPEERRGYIINLKLEIDFKTTGISEFNIEILDKYSKEIKNGLILEIEKRKKFINIILKELSKATDKSINRFGILRIYSGNLVLYKEDETYTEKTLREADEDTYGFISSDYKSEFEPFTSFRVKEHFYEGDGSGGSDVDDVDDILKSESYIPPSNFTIIEIEIYPHPQFILPYAKDILDNLINQINNLDSKLRSESRYLRFINSYKIESAEVLEDEEGEGEGQGDWIIVETANKVLSSLEILNENKENIDNILDNIDDIYLIKQSHPSDKTYYDNVNPLLKKEVIKYKNKEQNFKLYNYLALANNNINNYEIKYNNLLANYILLLSLLIIICMILYNFVYKFIVNILFLITFIIITLLFLVQLIQIVRTKNNKKYWTKSK